MPVSEYLELWTLPLLAAGDTLDVRAAGWINLTEQILFLIEAKVAVAWDVKVLVLSSVLLWAELAAVRKLFASVWRHVLSSTFPCFDISFMLSGFTFQGRQRCDEPLTAVLTGLAESWGFDLVLDEDIAWLSASPSRLFSLFLTAVLTASLTSFAKGLIRLSWLYNWIVWWSKLEIKIWERTLGRCTSVSWTPMISVLEFETSSLSFLFASCSVAIIWRLLKISWLSTCWPFASSAPASYICI